MNISQEQIIGRISALESIVCQLLTFHLLNNPEKDKIVAILRESLLSIKGNLEGDARTSCLEAANRIFDTAHATALHLERK